LETLVLAFENNLFAYNEEEGMELSDEPAYDLLFDQINPGYPKELTR
jgi:hypothetical protein